MKICILGCGMYSLALSLELAKKDNQITMWTENPKVYKEWEKDKKIASIYDCFIPDNISITTSLENALNGAKIVFFAGASKYIDKLCHDIAPFFKSNMHVCIASKGIEESTEELLSNVVTKNLKTTKIAVISGPTFAIDMLHNDVVALAIASLNKTTEKLVIDTLANETLKLRPTKDIIGIQICGAVKNCIAIASGIIAGLGYSISTEAFLINESLHEMKKIIFYLGGNPKTILSFAGVGDIMLTCTSDKSRNYKFGYTIGKTKDFTKVKKYLLENTVEGYYTLDVIYKLLKKKNIDIPLINIIYDIVYNEQKPEGLINYLMNKA